MKAFVVKLAGLLFPLALLIIVVNYHVDPANIHSGDHYVEGVARILANGHNVENISNYNERLLQEKIVKHITAVPDVVVLGSSRIMEISSEFFPGQRLLNCGVSHGNINDVISIVGLLDSLKKWPKHLVLGVDPELVSGRGTDEWHSLQPYHWHAMATMLRTDFDYNFTASDKLDKIRSILSLTYFQESVNYALKHRNRKYTDVGNARPEPSGRFSDGSICYPYEYTHPDTIKMAADAREDGRKNGMAEIDIQRLADLRALLLKVKEKGVDITLVMVPYHPDYFNAVNEKSDRLMIRAEETFSILASEVRVPVIGSFDPERYGLGNGNFYDRWHCDKAGIKKIFLVN